MKLVTTIQLERMPNFWRGGALPHHSQIMPVIESVIACHGTVIVLPATKTNRVHICKTITYLALAHFMEDGATVVIG